MNKKQIRRDYKNVDYVDANGKVKTRVEYVGATYLLKSPKAKTFKFLLIASTLAAIVFFVPPLFLNGNSLRTIYLTLPFVLQVFPLFVLSIGAYKMATANFPIREEVRSLIFDKAKIGAYFGVALAAVSLVCFFIFMGVGSPLGVDYVTLASAIGTLAAFIAVAVGFSRVEIERIDPQPEIAQSDNEEVAENQDNREESGDERVI